MHLVWPRPTWTRNSAGSSPAEGFTPRSIRCTSRSNPSWSTSCQVGGIVITNRPDSKNAQYQQCIKQGDILLNRYQHSTSDYVGGSCTVKIYTKTTFILQGAEAFACDQHLKLLGKTSAPTLSYTQIDWSENSEDRSSLNATTFKILIGSSMAFERALKFYLCLEWTFCS